MTSVIVTMRDVRAAKICSKGSRAWCKANGVDWSDFVMNGMPVERLEAAGDPIVGKIAAIARKRAAEGMQDG